MASAILIGLFGVMVILLLVFIAALFYVAGRYEKIHGKLNILAGVIKRMEVKEAKAQLAMLSDEAEDLGIRG